MWPSDSDAQYSTTHSRKVITDDELSKQDWRAESSNRSSRVKKILVVSFVTGAADRHGNASDVTARFAAGGADGQVAGTGEVR